jgi:hypothetical protein
MVLSLLRFVSFGLFHTEDFFMDYKNYKDWLEKNGLSDNSYNYYRFHHPDLTPYAISRMTGVSKSNLSRYSESKELSGSANALFFVLNKLDEMKKSGSSNVSSVDLF